MHLCVLKEETYFNSENTRQLEIFHEIWLKLADLPFFCLMSSWFCNFHRTLRFDKVKRSRELLKWKWGIFGSSLRKFCRSNFRELAKKILVSFTFGFAMHIFGFPRFSTITILFCNCLGPRNTRRISTFAAKISFWSLKKPENGNNFGIDYFKWTLFGKSF